MAPQFKVFHFLELDWLVYFPAEGNRGKYCRYTALLKERKGNESHKQHSITVGELLERAEFEEHYPHTVGFFKAALDEQSDTELRYLEIRTIHDVNEFWLFVNSVNL